MKIMSPNFEDNSSMPADFTADGANKCPDFFIFDVPSSVKSLALVCHDPDATSGVPWVHWLAWGIKPSTDKIIAGNLPPGSTSSINSFGSIGYGGPSPSPGTGVHRYVFSLYALSDDVNFEGQKTYQEIINIISPLSVTSASWTGLYQRN